MEDTIVFWQPTMAVVSTAMLSQLGAILTVVAVIMLSACDGAAKKKSVPSLASGTNDCQGKPLTELERACFDDAHAQTH